MITKATSQQINVAHLGRANVGDHPAEYLPRVTAYDLVRRYGMWVHRCVTLNAAAAAVVPVKLMSVVRQPETKAALHRLGYRAPSPRTKAFLAGRMDLAPGRVAAKRFRGDMDDLVEVDRSGLLDLIDDVNDWTDGYSWRESLYADLQLFGRAFANMVMQGGRPTELWRLMPQKTCVVPDPVEFVRYFRVGSGPTEVIIPPAEVLWFRLFDPDNPWGGFGPLEAWLKTVDASFAIQDFQHWLMNRGGAPDYIATTENPLTVDQQEAFRKSWRTLFGLLRNRRANVGFLSGNGKLERLGQTNRELEFGESERAKRDQIAQAFGVPISKLDVSQIRSNSREADQQWYASTIWPMVQRVEDVLNERLVPLFGDQMFIVHENPIPDDETITIQQRVSKLQAGWSVNELRADEGLEALTDEAADVPLVGQGLKPLEQAVKPPPPPPALFGGPGVPEDEDATEDDEGGQDPDPDSATDGQAAFTPEQLKQIEDLFKASASPVVTINTATPVEVEPAKVVHTISLKEMLGEIADDSYDGYQNPPFAKDLSAALNDILGDVVRMLRGPQKAAGDPFTVRQLEEMMTLEVAARWALALAEAARDYVADALFSGGEKALADLAAMPEVPPFEISFNLQNRRAQEYLDNASRRIGKDVTRTFTKQIREELIKGIDAGESTVQIAKRIEAMTELTPAQAERVARTETAFANVNGVEQGWKQSGLVSAKQFILAPDACPICEAVAAEFGSGRGGDERNKTVPLGKGFFELGDRIMVDGLRKDDEPTEIVFDYAPDEANVTVPPVHPNCRCSTAPVIVEAVEA